MKRIKFGIILFYLSLFVGLALYDEKPDLELAREMARPQPETIEPGNAWIVFLGFTSPEGVSPYARGEEKMRKLQNAVKKGISNGEFYTSIEDTTSELSFQGEMPSFPVTKDGGSLIYATKHPVEIAALLRNNNELLSRYESLRTYPRYTEPLDCGYYAPFPRFSPLRYAQRLKLLQLASKASNGDVAGALAEVREDAEFWRFIARNSKTLISKLVSIAVLNTDLRFAAELGAYRSLSKHELEIVQDILRPFDNDEISLTETLRGEARYGQRGMELSTWQMMKKWSPEKLLFKRNATNNRMYAYSKEFIRVAELSTRQFAEELKRQDSNKASIPRIGLPFLYNPTGEILAIIGIPSFMGYMEKGHNLEGLRRLSWLKVLSHVEQVPSEKMQQFLNSHSKEFGNPYTGTPMTWNSKKGSISFTGISGEKPVEIFL